MTTKINDTGRSRRSKWLSAVTGPQSRASRDEIERDAAAELGIQTPTADRPVEAASEQEPDEIAPAGRDQRRPPRVVGWVRSLVDVESTEARRQRVEREAAAELGVHDRPGERVG